MPPALHASTAVFFCFRSSQQGFDAACKSIFQCVGGNILAAVQVYSKWAVPVSWLLMNEYDEGQRAIEPVSTNYRNQVVPEHYRLELYPGHVDMGVDIDTPLRSTSGQPSATRWALTWHVEVENNQFASVPQLFFPTGSRQVMAKIPAILDGLPWA